MCIRDRNRALALPNALPSPPQPAAFGGSLVAPPRPPGVPIIGPNFIIDHLIYAYMVENTRIFDIYHRALQALIEGERLGVPPDQPGNPLNIVPWLRATEQLFYRDQAPFFGFTLTSTIRPDWAATRRNAYYRMFGYDLNHGGPDGKPYAFVKPDAANREFGVTLERFLACLLYTSPSPRD